MVWEIEVKHDTRHRKWHRLSVLLIEPYLHFAALHADQYAIDHQMNRNQIAFALGANI